MESSAESTRPRRSRSGGVRRYGFACLNCKARKSKCSGEQPVCGACRKAGVTCTWSAPADEKQLQHATGRIQQLEQALRESRASPQDRLQDSSPIAGAAADDGVTYVNTRSSPLESRSPPVLTNLHSHIGRGDDGSITYNGPTSRFHVGPLDETAIDETSLREVAIGPIAFASEGQRKSHTEALRSQYSLVSNGCIASVHYAMHFDRLGLNHDMCIRLLDIYWTWLQPLHNCVYRPLFLIDMAFGGQHYSDFLLLSLLSLSARHLSDYDGEFSEIEKGEKFLSRAKELLLGEISASKPRISTIQGLLILGGRQCAMGKNSEGWLYTGMAIKMLEDIGLHLRISDAKLVELERCTPVEVEVRKRLYNSAYIWEKTMCLALGRPPSLTQQPYLLGEILDQFDNNDEWKPVHAPEIAAQYVSQWSYNTSTFCAHTELHMISTDIMALFFAVSKETALTEGTKALGKRLREWYSNLPQQLCIDEPSQLHQSPPPHIVSLNVLYHALMVLLYRPSLTSNHIELVLLATQICSSASKAILAILTLYERTFPSRLMTYQVTYCVFTAATAQAYIMRNSHEELAKEAAKTLSSAMCILQHETQHTPGISGSLDTLRKQLMMGKPVRRNQRTSISSANQPLTRPQPLQQDGQRTGRTPSLQRLDLFDNHGLHATDQTGIDILHPIYEDNVDVDCEEHFGNGGISGIDTGAGFHPSVFPWNPNDWFSAGDWTFCS